MVFCLSHPKFSLSSNGPHFRALTEKFPYQRDSLDKCFLLVDVNIIIRKGAYHLWGPTELCLSVYSSRPIAMKTNLD